LIDRRELLAKARERKLNLNIVEKDYVLGWLLFGFSKINSLVFKGGTALSKIYFPEIWRLSEDLDFSILNDDFSIVFEKLEIIKLFGFIFRNIGRIWIAITHIILVIIFAITIIGIPFAKQHVKLASLALTPFGKEIR